MIKFSDVEILPSNEVTIGTSLIIKVGVQYINNLADSEDRWLVDNGGNGVVTGNGKEYRSGYSGQEIDKFIGQVLEDGSQ